MLQQPPRWSWAPLWIGIWTEWRAMCGAGISKAQASMDPPGTGIRRERRGAALGGRTAGIVVSEGATATATASEETWCLSVKYALRSVSMVQNLVMI